MKGNIKGLFFDSKRIAYFPFEAANDDDLPELLRNNLGCDIFECVNLSSGVSLWCDEEFNFKTEHWLDQYGFFAVHKFKRRTWECWLDIKGSFILLGGCDSKGRTLSIGSDFRMKNNYYLPSSLLFDTPFEVEDVTITSGLVGVKGVLPL